MDARPSRAAHAATGILSLLLLMSTILVLPPIPPFGASEHRVVTFYASHATRGYFYQFIAGLALLCVLWFLGYLYVRLRREVPDSPLPIIMVAAGTAWVAFAIVYLGLFQIFSEWAGQPRMRPLLPGFSDAYILGFMFNVFPAAVTVAAAAWSLRTSAGWPGWLRPLAVVALLSELVGAFPLLDPTGPIKPGGLITYGPFFMALLWISLASLSATRWERRTAGSPQAPAP